MGQAKQRGSREQRVAEALAREAEHQRQRQEYFEMRQNQMREERLQAETREAERNRGAAVNPQPNHNGFRSRPVMLAAALLAIGGGLKP